MLADSMARTRQRFAEHALDVVAFPAHHTGAAAQPVGK